MPALLTRMSRRPSWRDGVIHGLACHPRDAAVSLDSESSPPKRPNALDERARLVYPSVHR